MLHVVLVGFHEVLLIDHFEHDYGNTKDFHVLIVQIIKFRVTVVEWCGSSRVLPAMRLIKQIDWEDTKSFPLLGNIELDSDVMWVEVSVAHTQSLQTPDHYQQLFEEF